MDRLHFTVEETPASPLASMQAVPHVNGVRLTELLDAVLSPEELDEGESFYEDFVGLEPRDAFLPSQRYVKPSELARVQGKTVLLRCSCGDMVCTQVIARIRIDDRTVTWTQIEAIPGVVGRKHGQHRFRRPPDMRFDRRQYEAALRGPRD